MAKIIPKLQVTKQRQQSTLDHQIVHASVVWVILTSKDKDKVLSYNVQFGLPKTYHNDTQDTIYFVSMHLKHIIKSVKQFCIV